MNTHKQTYTQTWARDGPLQRGQNYTREIHADTTDTGKTELVIRTLQPTLRINRISRSSWVLGVVKVWGRMFVMSEIGLNWHMTKSRQCRQ